MSKLLYINASGRESTALRLGKRILRNKEIFFNNALEAIRFINQEHPKLIVVDNVSDEESIWDSINKINFSKPVKSISFISKKIPVSFYSLLLHFK